MILLSVQRQKSTDLMGAAAAVEAADDALVVPNFSWRRRTSRGGLATEFTNAILTCRPARTNTALWLKKTNTWETSWFAINIKQIQFIQIQRLLLPFGLLAWAEEMFWVSSLSRSSRSSCSLRYISLHDSYSWGDSRLKSRWQWRIHSSSDSSVNHWRRNKEDHQSRHVPHSFAPHVSSLVFSSIQDVRVVNFTMHTCTENQDNTNPWL